MEPYSVGIRSSSMVDWVYTGADGGSCARTGDARSASSSTPAMSPPTRIAGDATPLLGVTSSVVVPGQHDDDPRHRRPEVASGVLDPAVRPRRDGLVERVEVGMQ